MILGMIGAFFSSLCYSLVLKVPRCYIVSASCNASLSWGIFLIVSSYIDLIPAYFISGCYLTFVVQCLARIHKVPITVMLLPSIVPFVPGADIYKCIFYLVEGDLQISMNHFTSMFVVAGMLGLGGLSIDVILDLILKKERRYRNG